MVAAEGGIVADTTRTTTRKVGYLVAVIVNAVMLVIVNNILAWGWFSWLTEDFELLLPIVNLSIIASIFANLIYLTYDAQWFKTLADTGLLVISLSVAIRTWQVFPFDFTGWEFDWTPVIRVVLALAIVGMTIGLIVNVVRLIVMAAKAAGTHQATT